MKKFDTIVLHPRQALEIERQHREFLEACDPYHRMVAAIYRTATPKMFVVTQPDGSTRLESAGCVLPDQFQATVDWCRAEIRNLAVARGLIQPTEE